MGTEGGGGGKEMETCFIMPFEAVAGAGPVATAGGCEEVRIGHALKL